MRRWRRFSFSGPTTWKCLPACLKDLYFLMARLLLLSSSPTDGCKNSERIEIFTRQCAYHTFRLFSWTSIRVCLVLYHLHATVGDNYLLNGLHSSLVVICIRAQHGRLSVQTERCWLARCLNDMSVPLFVCHLPSLVKDSSGRYT